MCTCIILPAEPSDKDNNAQSSPSSAGTAGWKALTIIGVVVVMSIVGAIVGVVVSRDSSDSASTSAGTAGSGNSGADATTGSYSGNGKVSTSKRSTGNASTITSDPTSATYSVAAFAIGDWGTTVTQGSCCSRSSTFNDYDINAEDVVANVMNQQAGKADVPPKCVIGHGDNFYWNGINSADGRDSRFTTTFEGKFDGLNIKTIPWVNVLGNHDYGGADYICNSGDSAAKCSSSDELMTALKNKYSWQATYTSPNDDRWVLEDHFYVYTVEDSASGVSIDIFNVDSGDADSHGAMEVCCQCYGYAEGNDATCKNIARGDDDCCGGDTDMFDKCFAQFTAWSDDSRKQLEANIANSTATWKVVNSHYSPYAHYDQDGMEKWFKIIKDTGVHLWLNGHTHGENHDYSSTLGVHFVDNGAGGGIQKESASGIPPYAKDYVENLWTYDGQEYGFFSLTASKDWLKMQYHTADDKWSYAKTFNSTTIGGVTTKHCWYVPNDGTEAILLRVGAIAGMQRWSASKKATNSSSSVSSDAASATYLLAAFAIGDWGTTITKSSCCTRSSTYNNYDINAEDIVANVMNQQAGKADVAPKIIIGHGDNFYWSGIISADGRDSRFTTTFEDKYDGSNIKTIPW
ncbi:unnamed protein product [Phytophthora lilii]|uniref:Unnamed protein product n=1 Tax=Phytophthora lilii TaxID=2077276 RepID=A0A9W6TMZ4_9STRA|nr:unnamed protein product [Phytophthora lilii]